MCNFNEMNNVIHCKIPLLTNVAPSQLAIQPHARAMHCSKIQKHQNLVSLEKSRAAFLNWPTYFNCHFDFGLKGLRAET